MKALKYLIIVLTSLFLFVGCQKELSFENGLGAGLASGSLKSEFGNCLPVTTMGNYVREGTLTDSNYVVVQVNISAPGRYVIATDTANGFSFEGAGVITDSGLQSITLKGVGKPVSAEVTNFFVRFDSSVCTFLINVRDSAINPPVTSADYFPTTDSSNWTYQFETGDPDLNDSSYTAVSTTNSIFSGNIYRTFITSQNESADTSYYRKEGGIYYEYSDLNDLFLYGSTENNVDFIFLKDNVPVSSTWESPEVNSTLDTIPGKAKIKFTIEGKDIQTTIGNTTIDSVIQVKREYMFAPSFTGTYQTIITGNFFYAKNIGFIKAETSEPYPLSIFVTKWKIYY